MIPIRDVQGRVVAFTARQLPETPEDDPARDAKYVNSPETPIFHKGRILFGMDHARKHLNEGGAFLLVEGQLDAIRCWSVGLHTAVAPQGTAVTEDQLNLLRRYEPSLIECLLDGDSAGRKAAIRALPLIFKAGLEFRFLLLPDNADPDDLLREHGAVPIEELRKTAKSGVELAINDSLPSDRKLTTHDKTTALGSVFELLHYVTSDVAREDYIIIAARFLKVDPQAALRDFQNTSSPRNISVTPNGSSKSTQSNQDPLLTRATWELLWLVSHHPDYGTLISEIIDYEWIDTCSTEGRLLTRVLAELQEGLLVNSGQIDAIVDSVEERKLMANIQARELSVEEPVKQIEFCLERLRRTYVETKIKEVEQKIFNTEPESQIKLMRDRKALISGLKSPLRLQS